MQAGSSVVVRVLANDTDPDSDTLAVVGASAARGVTCVGAKGLVRYTPNVGRNDRTDTFTYGVTDGDRYRTGTVTVDVTGLKPVKPVLKKRLILKHNGKVKQRAQVTFTNTNTKRVLLDVEGVKSEKTIAERFVYPGRSFTFSTKERQLFFASLLAPKTGETGLHQRRPAQHAQRRHVLAVHRRALRLPVVRGSVPPDTLDDGDHGPGPRLPVARPVRRSRSPESG